MADAKSTRAADLMRHAFEGIAKRDVDQVTSISDEHTVNDFWVTGPVVGKPAIRAFFVEMFAAVPDLQFEIVRILDVDENTAVGQWHLTGTFSGGPFQDIEPTGRRVDLQGIDIMEFEGGVLRRNTISYDGLAFARQIGLLPAEGSATDRAMMAAFNAAAKAKARFRR